MGGGGAGYWGVYQSSQDGGGGGAGSGGGTVMGSYGSAGEVLEFDKIVPSESQTYNITIGAGGSTNGNTHRAGCGGQGIVIIKY